MQRYILTRVSREHSRHWGSFDERAETWLRKARDLRIRRERQIKQQQRRHV